MERKEAKNCINECIKGYKIERNTDVFKSFGLGPIVNTYQLFASNFASLPQDTLTHGILFAALGFTVYENCKLGHSLTDEINTLKRLRNNLKDENELINIMDEETFDDCLTKRKTLL